MGCQHMFSPRGFCSLCGAHRRPDKGYHPDFGSPYADFVCGKRVGTHPATDAWMQGDRYGTVVAIEPVYVRVKLDSGRVMNFTRDLIRRV